jgi:predicted TIM-barrel enzyme
VPASFFVTGSQAISGPVSFPQQRLALITACRRLWGSAAASSMQKTNSEENLSGAHQNKEFHIADFA